MPRQPAKAPTPNPSPLPAEKPGSTRKEPTKDERTLNPLKTLHPETPQAEEGSPRLDPRNPTPLSPETPKRIASCRRPYFDRSFRRDPSCRAGVDGFRVPGLLYIIAICDIENSSI